MVNKLEMGTRRVGDFIDFDPDTPEVKVILERSEHGISITLPWSEPGSPYAGWFVGDGFMQPSVLEGEEPAERKPVPKRVLFHDSHGPILLTGCRAKGFHANFWGPGSGTLWSRVAILGVDHDVEYDKPHGLKTEISGLREWLGVTSWNETYTWPDGPVAASFSSVVADKFEIGDVDGIALSFVPGWAVVPESGRDARTLKDLMRCTTRSTDPRSWRDHYAKHRAICDLLVLSRWWNESCVEVLAYREDDPLTTMDGKEHGEQWRNVVVSDDTPTAPPSGYRPHIIRFADLQVGGIKAWIALHDEFSRALDPVITCINLKEAGGHTRLAHTGPGLEALGYLLMIRDSVAEKDAAHASLRARLERILADLGDSLPFEGADWVDSFVEVYNGIKHANRAEPDMVDVLNAWQRGVLVVRAWVAAGLGVPLDELKTRLKDDSQQHGFVKVT